jgi:hypothetical protein
VNILVLMEFPEGDRRRSQPEMDQADLNALLQWLESGARPKDPWVYNHMLYNLAGLVSGDDTHRLLRIFNAHPERAKNYWIVANLRDPAALPLIEYWSTLPTPPDQIEVLKGLIARLDNRSHARWPATKPCCEATEICLMDHLTRAEPSSPVEIHSDEQARAWLARTSSAPIDFDISYTDELKRSAIVRFKSGDEQHWEFLYDCWRRTDPVPPITSSKSDSSNQN